MGEAEQDVPRVAAWMIATEKQHQLQQQQPEQQQQQKGHEQAHNRLQGSFLDAEVKRPTKKGNHSQKAITGCLCRIVQLLCSRP